MVQDPESRHYITKENGTEPAFRNVYWNHYHSGLYVDPYNGQVLFASIHKYDSGSGWPSFYKAVHNNNIELKDDHSLGMKRVEVRSSDSHLGHLFDDGPPHSGKRYCINSAALRFVPEEDIAKKGYADYGPLFTENPQEETRNKLLFATAIFAGGCFWCIESAFEGIEGVMKVQSGYTGGTIKNPSYEEVSSSKTGHYEAIMILYQPAVLCYQNLLDIFWQQIDPTDGNGQFYDRGSQYRTAIFYRTKKERQLAKQSKVRLHTERFFGNQEIVTEILPEKPFYLAEKYHQDYFAKEPQRYQSYIQASGRKSLLQSLWNKQKKPQSS